MISSSGTGNRLSNVNNLSKQLLKGSTTDYATITADTWSKVEIDVNDNTKVYTITVTPYNSDGTLNTASKQTFDWTDTDANRYFKGIMGIRISRNPYTAAEVEAGSTQTGAVTIDNVKVYKASMSYLNDDFDDYTASGYGEEKALPSGWMAMAVQPTWWNLRYEDEKKKFAGVTGDTGKAYDTTANPNDKSLYLYYDKPTVYKSLDMPVPAGEPFVVEFDIYNSGENANASPWMFMQMGKEDTHMLGGYNTGKSISKNGKAFVEPLKDVPEGPDGATNLINDTAMDGYTTDTANSKTVADTYARINGNKMTENVVFGRHTYGDAFYYSPTGRFDAKRGFNGYHSGVGMTDVLGEWVNYKVLCEPISATQTKYTVTQSKADGTVAAKSFTNSRDWYTHDTYAIGFAVSPKSGAYNTNDGVNGTKIDNVKVYATDGEGSKVTAVTNNYIESITANSADGKSTEVLGGDTVPVGTKSIDITFSMPINEQLSPTLPGVDSSLPEVHSNFESDTRTKGSFTKYFDTTGNCYTDYTSVLDNIKDVVSVRKANSQLQVGTISISKDKRTVTVTFGEALAAEDKYTVGVNKNIAFDGDGYATLSESFVKTYTVGGDFATDAIDYAELSATVFRGTANIPIHKAGPIAEGETITTALTGKNTGSAPVQAYVAYAFYTTDSTTGANTLKSIQSDIIEIQAGVDGELASDVILSTITIPEGCDSVKLFSWTYPDMQPYVRGTKGKAQVK